MMASLLLPIPLLPDESKSSDSNILISLIVNGSTVLSLRIFNVGSGVLIDTDGNTDDGATELKISADAISIKQFSIPFSGCANDDWIWWTNDEQTVYFLNFLLIYSSSSFCNFSFFFNSDKRFYSREFSKVYFYLSYNICFWICVLFKVYIWRND